MRRADFRRPGGYAGATALLRSARPPDALFVGNNLMTLGVLHALGDLGLAVPRDVGVAGFDDSPAADLLRPRLTVVEQPTAEIGPSWPRCSSRSWAAASRATSCSPPGSWCATARCGRAGAAPLSGAS